LLDEGKLGTVVSQIKQLLTSEQENSASTKTLESKLPSSSTQPLPEPPNLSKDGDSVDWDDQTVS
jgi:hypothetical protein